MCQRSGPSEPCSAACGTHLAHQVGPGPPQVLAHEPIFRALADRPTRARLHLHALARSEKDTEVVLEKLGQVLRIEVEVELEE